MKTILLLLFPILLTAQGDFKINNNKVTWSKIFYDVSDEEYTALSSLEGDLEERTIDYKAMGKTRGSVTIILLAYNLSGNVAVDRKDNRVRVLVTDMYFIKNINALQYAENKMAFEDFAIKRGEFRKRFIKDAPMLQNHLETLLSYNSVNNISDDW